MEQKESQKSNVPIPSGAEGIFEWWNNKSKIEETDSVGVKVKKIGIRILGILLLIIFSPILITIFLFVFAVSL